MYNCTNNSPEIAKQSRDYVKICVEECIKPMGVEMTNSPQHALPLIQTLMDLIGVKNEESNNSFDSNNNNNNNNNIPSMQTNPNNTTNFNSMPGANNVKEENTTFLQPIQQQQQQQQQQPSPMSVHAIVSGWNETQDTGKVNQPSQESFVPNNVSAAAWQTLFASAATPFFDNEPDWQGKFISM